MANNFRLRTCSSANGGRAQNTNMSNIACVQVFNPWDKSAGACAVPDCDEFVEANSGPPWCVSCRAKPPAVLNRLGIETEKARPDDDARQTGSVGYCPIR
jgi:hypothetical protein